MAVIRPNQLPAAASVNPAAAIIVDDGGPVEKATPIQVVDAARPKASQNDAETGTDNEKIMTPLRVKQAIDELADSSLKPDLASTDGAGMVGTESGDTVQEALDNRVSRDLLDIYRTSAWTTGGGSTIVSDPDINHIADIATIDSVVVLGGRGHADDPNEIPGERYRSSYSNYIGYVRVGSVEIGGNNYDLVTKATDLNPSANPELVSIIGGGHNDVSSLASACIGALHCTSGPYGSHSWNVACTTSISDGHYSINIGGTNNENYSNRGACVSSVNCRIGTKPTTAAEAITNASLTRHSTMLAANNSTTNSSYTFNYCTDTSTALRDFARASGFGASGEIYNSDTIGMAFNTRGDCQVTRCLLSRTVTPTANALLATGDWQFRIDASEQEKLNARGTVICGTDTQLNITAWIHAMEKGGDGYYTSRVEIIVRRDGTDPATLTNFTEYEVETNRGTGAGDWSVNVTVASSGVVTIDFDPDDTPEVLVQAECSVRRLRDFTASSPISPPIPFAPLGT